jgi:hypothetical protein
MHYDIHNDYLKLRFIMISEQVLLVIMLINYMPRWDLEQRWNMIISNKNMAGFGVAFILVFHESTKV